jgi:hypothetical protein
MFELINFIIKYLGLGNTLTIILFLISLFIAFYFYYKTFFRLIYSTGRICKRCKNVSDWNNNETEFTTRFLLYNNGRKTITRNEIQKLELKSSNKIISVGTIKGNENIKTTNNSDTISIDIEYLDSSEFIVLEIDHKGQLDVIGRVSETGNILHTEPKYWLILNIVFLVFTIIMMFYYSIIFYKQELPTLQIIINVLILFGIASIIRFIHSLLFIPYSVSSKYLSTNNTNNKFYKDFND